MSDQGESGTGSLGFEDKLWNAADLLRNNMDPSEYKHVVLGLIFLKYISDAFEERRTDERRSAEARRRPSPPAARARGGGGASPG